MPASGPSLGAMRAFVISGLLASLFLAAAPVLAGAEGVSPVVTGDAPSAADTSEAAPRRAVGEKSMDQLFATLADRSDEQRGRQAEAEIQRRWMRSGSATIDLLMGWAREAAGAKNYALALDYLDQVVMLKPDYAEGWNRRATIFYMQDQYGKAISDLEKVLALEPRHFGALAGLGMILQEMDRKADALAAFEKALALDPYLKDDVGDAAKRLKPEVEGRAI